LIGFNFSGETGYLGQEKQYRHGGG
jgi:hypothetical protein